MNGRSNPYAEYMEQGGGIVGAGKYSYHNSLARSQTEELDNPFYTQTGTTHRIISRNGAPQDSANSSSLEESPSALIIKKIVQDLVDLQHQIIGGKILNISVFSPLNYY